MNVILILNPKHSAVLATEIIPVKTKMGIDLNREKIKQLKNRKIKIIDSKGTLDHYAQK